MSGGSGGEIGSAITQELVATLVARIEELERTQARLQRERDEYRKLYTLAREEIEQLKRGLIGQKAQRAPKDGGQLALFLLELGLGGAQSGPIRGTHIQHQWMSADGGISGCPRMAALPRALTRRRLTGKRSAPVPSGGRRDRWRG